MAAEHAAAGSTLTPTEYIQHHLTFFTRPLGQSGWQLNVDTFATTVVLALLAFGFIWRVTRRSTSGVPSKRQAFVELLFDFINEQVKGIYHGESRMVAPIALTTGLLVLFLNAMDFLPVDITSRAFEFAGFHNWRPVPTADVNTTFALSLSVFAMMIFYSIKVKGVGGWLHELVAAPFGLKPLWMSPFLAIFNVLFNLVEYISKPLSHSLRLFGNMYAGELIFMLIGLLAAAAVGWTVLALVLQFAWILFHVLIVGLQAYIFMMLTIVYIAMAHEGH